MITPRARSLPSPLPANALRTILLVAARGVVGRTELAAFQRALPERDWGAMTLDGGWHPLKPVLSWETCALPGARAVSVRAILGALPAVGRAEVWGVRARLIEDLCHLLATERPESPSAALDQVVLVPHTEPGVKLGRLRRRVTLAAYEDALRWCADADERARLRERVDLDAAAREIRRVLDALRPPALYEAVNHLAPVDRTAQVARALLARRKSARLRGDRVSVCWLPHEPDRVHRLYLSSRLGLRSLCAALGVPRTYLRRSDHLEEGVATQAFPDVEPMLRRASFDRARPRA